MNTETRRKSERTKVASNEIVYLHFQTGNGGIVLDVSAEGLGFQAADPLHADESLPFRLSVPGFPEITLSGLIVWLDSTRKRGGMRLNVPAESVKLFQQWQRRYIDAAEGHELPASSADTKHEPVAWQRAAGAQTATRSRAPQTSPAARNESQPANPAPASQPEPPRTNPPPPPPPNPFAHRTDSILGGHGPIFVSEWEVPPEPPRTGRNILVACVILGLCAAVAGGSYYLTGKRAVGNMLINLGQQIGGANQHAAATASGSASGSQATPGAPYAPTATLPQSASSSNVLPSSPPSTVPNTPPAPAAALPPQLQTSTNAPDKANSAAIPQAATPPPSESANANAIPADDRAAAATMPQTNVDNQSSAAPAPRRVDATSRPIPSASKRAPQRPAASADNGGADLNEALIYLRSPNSQDTAVAEELLWSAIGKGNTQADLVLGDLYMRGQGAVRRNCGQAEVLLHAALVADVPGADEKLGELQTYGCH